MCGPGFVGRAAEASDLAGVAPVAADYGPSEPGAAPEPLSRGVRITIRPSPPSDALIPRPTRHVMYRDL
jgi:hypothetical protein